MLLNFPKQSNVILTKSSLFDFIRDALLGAILTLKDPFISESYIEIKIELNFYFHASLWCLKRFYRTKQFCNRCYAVGLEQNVWFCIPTLQRDMLGDKQASLEKFRSNDTSGTHMADTTLVYSATKNTHTMPIVFASPTKAIIKSPRRKIYSCENQVPKVSYLENRKRNLRIGRKFKQFSQTHPLSRRPGSILGYKSAWNKWVIWCCQQQIDRVCAPLSKILNYLSTLFEKGPQYRT